MTTTPRTTRQTTPAGDPAWVGEGSARQEGTLPLYRCNTCHADVVWATSRRTGRKYLADVVPGYKAKHYVKASAHQCGPRVDRLAAQRAADDAQAAYMTAFRALQADRKAGTVDDLDARLDDLDRLADAAEAASAALATLA